MRLAETWFKLGITFPDISTNCQLSQKSMVLENNEFNDLTIFLAPFIFFIIISFHFSLYFSLNCIDQQSSTLLHFPNQIPIGCNIFFSFTEGNFQFDQLNLKLILYYSVYKKETLKNSVIYYEDMHFIKVNSLTCAQAHDKTFSKSNEYQNLEGMLHTHT